jgi:hypothetical protein
MSVNLETIKLPARSFGLSLRLAILVAALVVAGFIGAVIGARINGAATPSRQPAVTSHTSGGASDAGAPVYCTFGRVGPC